MLEVAVIVQEGEQNGRTGFDVFLVHNSLNKNTGLLHTHLGNVDGTKEEAEEAARLWRAAFHSFKDDGKKEVGQLKNAGFTFCTIHNSVSRGNRCDQSEGEIKAHEDNLVTKELEEAEELGKKVDNKIMPGFGLTPKEKRRLEGKFKVKPLEVRECELLTLFYMVPTKL